MRGRKRVPTELADLHGNPSKRRQARPAPTPIGALAEPPEHFNDEQRAI